ncbi:hypothetical protein GCM10020295_77680 [Streptomyces cinereospinus]
MTVVCLESLTFGLGRLVRAADALGERLRLLTRDPAYYAYELAGLPPGALDVVETDTFDVQRLSEDLHRTPELHGLISSTDTWTLVGAELTTRHDLPGLDPAVLRLTRDKAAVRNRLHERGLTRGRAVEATAPGTDLRELLLKEAGLPAVLKDTAGTGSQNVWLVRDGEELDAALGEAAGRATDGTALRRALLHRAGVQRRDPHLVGPDPAARRLQPADVTGAPLPRGDHRLPRRLPRGTAGVAGTVARRGARRPRLHRPLRPRGVRPDRRRTGGGGGQPQDRGAPWSARACAGPWGVNVYEAMIEAALGRRPRLMDAALPGGPAVAFVLGYPAAPGTFTGVAGLDRLAAMPGSPAWYPVKRIGDAVEHLGDSRGYAGIVYAEAETAELATHRAVAAANAVRVRTEPFPPPAGAGARGD